MERRRGEGREEGTAFTPERVITEHLFVRLVVSTQQTGGASHIFKSLIFFLYVKFKNNPSRDLPAKHAALMNNYAAEFACAMSPSAATPTVTAKPGNRLSRSRSPPGCCAQRGRKHSSLHAAKLFDYSKRSHANFKDWNY